MSKTFRVGLRNRPVSAVKDVSLQVEQGEIFGFVGPNGAGKSTTIHMLLGLVRPDRGVGTVLGERLGSIKSRRRIGYLPELPDFYSYLKARELLELSGRLAGLDDGMLKKRIPEVMRRVGLEGHEEDLLKTFSKGMKQRTGLAQAILAEPDLVILDEPMSGLDPLGRHVVRQVILDLKKSGCTVFFSSHVMPDIEALCDRVALIADGSTILTDTVDSLLGTGSKRFEIHVRTSEAAVGDFSSQWIRPSRAGDILRFEVEGERQMQQAVDWCRSNGELVAVIPVREHLEDIVVRTLGGREAS